MVPKPTPEQIAQSLKPHVGRKIGFVHLGCPKNLVDTETMLGLLEADGHQIVGDEADADVMLVNTCAFIDSAQKESIQVLANLAEGGKKLLVTGCLAQKFQSELLDLFPEAEAVVGIHSVPDIANIVRRTATGERVTATQQDPTFVLEDDTVRRHVTMGAWAYLKIAEGCDYKCSFCIIPSMRGAFRSRDVENILDNARKLVDRGVKEVILVGQDTTSYGKDIGSSLAELLHRLSTEVDGMEWLRFMYAYPNLVNDDLLTVIREQPKIVKYMDVPLQHTHPAVLKRMRRPVMDHVAFSQHIRQSVPGIKLRTGFIVGFPGETEDEFQHLKAAMTEARWDRLGVFEYSDVDTSHSKTLENKVDKATIKRRRGELMALQQQIAFEENQQLIGQTVNVIVDEINAYGQATARTQWDAPEVDNSVLVKVGEGQTLLPGEILPVRITHAGPYDVKAVLA
jgi:ribosomal protein S12 methylthiotransferase